MTIFGLMANDVLLNEMYITYDIARGQAIEFVRASAKDDLEDGFTDNGCVWREESRTRWANLYEYIEIMEFELITP
jgi:hypothetical protein